MPPPALTEVEKRHGREEMNLALQRLGIQSEVKDSLPKGILYEVPISLRKKRSSRSTNIEDPLLADNRWDIALGTVQHQGFRALSYPFNPGTHQDCFQVNSFEMGGRTAESTSSYVETSRLNHFVYQTPTYGIIIWVGTKDIKSGEEVFVDYRSQDCYKSRDQRQLVYRRDYGSDCTCRACRAGRDFGIASKQRRSQMRTLRTRINPNERPSRQ